MAKKQKVNKTKTVLQFLKTHRGAGNKEVSEALAKQAIKVSPAHVANIKGKAKALRHARKQARAPAAPAPQAATASTTAEKPTKPGDTLTLEHVKAVAKTVKAIGGFDRLNELLGVIKEVGGMKRFKDLMEAISTPETDEIRLPF